jgi:MFS transporter, SHS family, lactate transporter
MVNGNSLPGGLHSFAIALHMKPFQGLIWFTGWSAWTLASLQFYLLPFTLSNIAKFLDVEQSQISEVNTYTMLSRSLGAIIFGVLSDQYGRKIPLLVDLVCLGVLTLASGFIHTYAKLIGVRFLFGKSNALPSAL